MSVLRLRPLMRPCLLLLLLVLGLPSSLQAATLVQQNFDGIQPTTGWTFGAGAAITSGWLRLTNASSNDTGYAFYGTPFTVNQGFVIDFEFLSWGGSGADGLVFFLFDGTANFRIGTNGGSLGYANGCSGGDGMRRAYLGIAFDEFGNFSNPADHCKSGGPGARPDAVTLRGAGDYTNGPVGTNYAYLTHNTAPTSIDCPAPTCSSRPANTSAQWRRARITMLDTGPSWSVTVDVQFGAGQPFTRVINPYTLPTPPYTTLKLGFSAATGGSTNYHEVRNLLVTNPVDTTISKTVSTPDAMVGQAFSYALNISNSNLTAAANVVVTDTLPTSRVSYTGYSISPSGGSCSFASPTLTCSLGSMATSSSKTITVNVQGTSQGTASNSADVDQDDIDINPNDNSASVSNTVWNPPSLTVTKSAANTGGSAISSLSPGNDIVYTIQTINSGGPSKSNVLTDAMSPFTALRLDTFGAGQPFQFLAGNSTLTMPAGSISYSNDNGATWTYTPVSGGGGAPAGYDGAVTNFRINLSGTMGSLSSGTTNYSLRYHSRLE